MRVLVVWAAARAGLVGNNGRHGCCSNKRRTHSLCVSCRRDAQIPSASASRRAASTRPLRTPSPQTRDHLIFDSKREKESWAFFDPRRITYVQDAALHACLARLASPRETAPRSAVQLHAWSAPTRAYPLPTRKIGRNMRSRTTHPPRTTVGAKQGAMGNPFHPEMTRNRLPHTFSKLVRSAVLKRRPV